MTFKAFLMAAVALAVAVGLVLPVPYTGGEATQSQIETISIGHG